MNRVLEKEEKWNPAPVAKLIGITVKSAAKGRALLGLRAERRHENTIGTTHGGILCDLSDAAMGYAFESALPKGRRGVTVEFKINFLKPARAGDLLTAKAWIVSHGKSLYYLECEIQNGKKVLIAKAASTCKVLS